MAEPRAQMTEGLWLFFTVEGWVSRESLADIQLIMQTQERSYRKKKTEKIVEKPRVEFGEVGCSRQMQRGHGSIAAQVL